MKSIIKHIGLLILAIAALAGCKRFDPEDRIIKTLDLPQCLKPVSVKTTVKYNFVTFDLKVFPDAEKYVLELYKGVIYEDTEPSEDDLLDRVFLNPEDIPCEITTIEDATIYYRIAAINETAGKAQSFWTVGRFKTTVDPSHICVTPDIELGECFEMIRFNWQTSSTDKYLLEVYNSSIPSSGDPDEAELFKRVELTYEEVPYSGYFPVKSGKYYYRVKAIDLAGERSDSKWAQGSFTPETFSWPNDEKALDYGLTAPFVDSYDEPARTEIRKLFSGSDNPAASGTIYSTTEVVWNKIHYMPECGNMNDRISTRGNGQFTEESEYGVILPKTKRFIHFYINQPGQFKAILRKADGGKGTVALLTNKKGLGAQAIYLFDSEDISTGKGDPTVLDITAEMLYGILEPAQVFIFSSVKTKALYLYPITWTPWTPPTE